MAKINTTVDVSWEELRVTSFTRVRKIVRENVEGSTLSTQLHENKFVTALYLSQIAYFKFSTISADLSHLGARKISLYDSKGTQGYLAELDDIVVVSFRGTQVGEKEDVRNALTFWTHPFQELKAHKGFVKSFEDLVPQIKSDLEYVDQTKRVVYVGHSMGGALATLLSIAHKPDELCTFGAPRVADKRIREILHDVEHNRIVTKWDWVTMLPPHIPFISPYRHVGEMHVLPTKWRWTNLLRPHRLVTYLQELLKHEDANK